MHRLRAIARKAHQYTSITYLALIGLIETVWEYVFQYIAPKIPEATINHRFQRYGIIVNGNRNFDIHVFDNRFYIHLLLRPDIGLGESFAYEWWTCDDMAGLFDRLIQNGYFNANEHTKLSGKSLLLDIHTWTLSWSHRNNDVRMTKDYKFFRTFLDTSMSFSCGYWLNADTLDEAQVNKMELIAQKLKLEPGMSVLEIGCGWGALAKYLACNYHVNVTGCTLYHNQAEFASQNCEGLSVHIHHTKYTHIHEKFDRIVSVARFEYVHPRHYRKFFRFAAKSLKDDGLFLLHTIGVNQPSVKRLYPFLRLYIFPDLEYPYHTDLAHSIDGLFVLEDWQNMGHHYIRTLAAWLANFQKTRHKRGRMNRIWMYFLHLQASLFRNNRLQVWQLVLSKSGFRGGYEAVRLNS